MLGTIESPITISQWYALICVIPNIFDTGGKITKNANRTTMAAALKAILGLSFNVRLNIDCLLLTVNTCKIEVHPTIKNAIVCPIINDGGY